MEQYNVIVSGTASYCGLNIDQRSSTETSGKYEISDALGDLTTILHSAILPEKQYRVIAGQLYVIHPGSPPNSLP